MNAYDHFGHLEGLQDKPIKCTECRKETDGSIEWSDGSGFICKACDTLYSKEK
tara:strand:- start:63 stop:221 length:159 start_codon:yes stop_codon:yes gene_type:complete